MSIDFGVNTASSNEFLKSTLAGNGSFLTTQGVVGWLKDQNDAVKVNINTISFNDLDKWVYDKQRGVIRHETGKFFSIDGIKVRTNWGEVEEWEQPIINQPEIGYLGFIVKKFDGVLHFLVQAKIEPGNVNSVQISPTLQATRSNYTQVHKGKKPQYLDYFLNCTREQILLDQLQSEQGARFLKKRNRNIIIRVDDEVEVYDNYLWVTLAQIKDLMRLDNLVNMDTRTVISGIPFGGYDDKVIDLLGFANRFKENSDINAAFLKSALSISGAVNSIDSIIAFITGIKSVYDLDVFRVDIKNTKDWLFGKDSISHKDGKYFRVIAVDVQIENREVVKWSQPMVEPAQEGICAFVCKEINGILHFAVQAKLECGNHDIIEFAPTVQCLTGNYRDTERNTLPFLEYVLSVEKSKIVYDTIQSEEGGRFYREQNRNIIIIAGDEVSFDLPANYLWMTLNQLYSFIRYNNYLNIQARSLIAAITFI